MWRLRTQRSVLGLALHSVLVSQSAWAVDYRAAILNSSGYDLPSAVAISGRSVVGLANASDGNLDSLLWDASANTVTSLNPSDNWAIQMEDIWHEDQVGHGSGPLTNGDKHALLWHGSTTSLVDLHPSGFIDTHAYGIWGSNQVGSGWGAATGGRSHAIRWNGSAESVMDIHPTTYAASQANAVFQERVVGAGYDSQGASRALLWTPSGVMDLHSTDYAQSFAADVSADSEVGDGIISTEIGGTRHALLWHGTAASGINLHPMGFAWTSAQGVVGSRQVGVGAGPATGGQQHALLWEGTAASVVDLHRTLNGLELDLVSSWAVDIDANGVIVGTAIDSGGSSYAVIWFPIPEPSSSGIAAVGLFVVTAQQRRARPRSVSCSRWLNQTGA